MSAITPCLDKLISVSPSRSVAVLIRPNLLGESSFALPSEYNRLRDRQAFYYNQLNYTSQQIDYR